MNATSGSCLTIIWHALPSFSFSPHDWIRDKVVRINLGHADRENPQGQERWSVVQGPGKNNISSRPTPNLLGQDLWGFCGILRIHALTRLPGDWYILKFGSIALENSKNMIKEAWGPASPCAHPVLHAHLCMMT